MPFSKTTNSHTENYWTKHYENFLKPLVEENTNLKAHRSKALRGDILREIINRHFPAVEGPDNEPEY